MSALFDKYFSNGEINKGKANFVYDIRSGAVSYSDAIKLIRELAEKNMLHGEGIIHKNKSEWDVSYLQNVSSKFLMGNFSENFLSHLAEVADHVNRHRRSQTQSRKKIIIAAVVVVILVIVAISKCSSTNKSTKVSSWPAFASYNPSEMQFKNILN